MCHIHLLHLVSRRDQDETFTLKENGWFELVYMVSVRSLCFYGLWTRVTLPSSVQSPPKPVSDSNQHDLSCVTSVHLNNTSSTVSDLARNPGLVAVLCIFFIVLALLLVVAIAKAISSRRPKFEKLEDVPMNKMNEESPFALYPPK
ncbi:hypothetical protein AGOR_G00147970 [Albula goreensis]|uniref:Uncharacterized protein n=1 Tax=Albula goreensis TaxID=1534307 RepID=A0A8T3D2I7_9TELE|nr:hypothetical protein AGOR_G00147970 [Albula goreensis]